MAKNKKGAGLSWVASLGKVMLQLLIVFVGVYAAFSLERYNEKVRTNQSLDQLYNLLNSEVESIKMGMRVQFEAFEEDYFRPFVLQPSSERSLKVFTMVIGDMRSPELQSVISDISLLAHDHDLLPALQSYNRSIQYYIKITDEFRLVSIERLIGEHLSYLDENGSYLAQFYWYPSYLIQKRNAMIGVIESAELLSERLQHLKQL